VRKAHKACMSALKECEGEKNVATELDASPKGFRPWMKERRDGCVRKRSRSGSADIIQPLSSLGRRLNNGQKYKQGLVRLT